MFLMQAAQNVGITDNEVLDQWRVPFGDWMEQSVFWITNNVGWLLDGIKWPFDNLINLINGQILEPISWVWVVLAFFVIGTLVRNVKVGAFSAIALGFCGILGNAYWLETARTIGFIGVAVFFCVLIGVPLGIACGRSDAIWQVVRPILDAMQVVHSFVYMLPFIFFWGIGEVSATMVTMIFALPPLVRLTNLGIRQVPEDVVEASRAYGAPEWRVLVDVQMPLARPAIMTGLNQTLLLSISMLGLAALMGAGGLGRLLFRAISNQDVALGASAGVAFFLVAVVLDRISQTESTDGISIVARIGRAWSNRKTPDELLPTGEATPVDSRESSGWTAEISQPEIRLMGLAAGGAVLTVLSMLFSWSVDAGKVSSFGRSADKVLTGESFNGLSATGGSWFGLVVLALSLFVIGAVVVTWKAPGQGPRWMTADGAAIAALAALAVSVTYVVMSEAQGAGGGSIGIGAYLAIAGSLAAAAGSILWAGIAPHEPLHPLLNRINRGQLLGVSMALLIMFVSSISAWSFDDRQEVVQSPEITAQIADLKQQAVDRPADAGVIASQIQILLSTVKKTDKVVHDGLTKEGPRLGIWELVLGAAALVVAIPASGALDTDERRRWFWNTVLAGIGASASLVSVAWIASLVRSADPGYVSGVGSFLALVSGVIIVASSMGVLKEFRRETVYPDHELSDPSAHQEAAGHGSTDGPKEESILI